MSKKISIGTAVILMLLAVLVTFQLTFMALSNKYQSELNELTISQDMYAKLAAVDELYRTLYIGDIDEKTLTDNLIRGYVLGTGDKYAYYLDEEQFAEMMASNNAELQGIGIMVIYQNDMIEIISVMPDSPALDAGLEPGDIIAYVDGESVAELGYTAAVNRLQGEAGTLAEFTVQRGDELIDFSIERGYVNEQSVMYHVYEPDPTIGIVKILSFNLGTPEQFKSACEELIAGGVTKFVFDVRYNPGGDLESITEILDYLLPEGPIVRIVDAEGNEDVRYSDASELDMPMCVLVNSSTASAAELFSSALQDYDKAELVGTVTYGKGTMQTIIRLADNTGLGISYRMYNPPYSDNYEGVGVQPDYVVEMDESVADKNIYKITDAEDTQLQKAIELLTQA
ncbi:MAG TPA: PDZ domain-containing protein [Firmicutes bacterium]|nr:PDZ domain-containing protein [Bacillota bacterium]